MAFFLINAAKMAIWHVAKYAFQTMIVDKIGILSYNEHTIETRCSRDINLQDLDVSPDACMALQG